MVRTQIQITPEQAEALRRLASSLKVSQAELIRRGIDRLIRAEINQPSADRRKRALASAGRFSSDRRDVSIHHDKYLAEAFKK